MCTLHISIFLYFAL